MFYILGSSAEDYFSPTVASLSDELGLSHNVAGVTLLALGNAAPDLFSSFAAVTSPTGADGLGIGGLLGGGIFITTVVLSSVTLIAKFRVTRRPFLRDISFYILAVIWVGAIAWDEKVSFAESIAVFCLYIFYVLVVIIARKIYQGDKAKKLAAQGGAAAQNTLQVPGIVIAGAADDESSKPLLQDTHPFSPHDNDDHHHLAHDALAVSLNPNAGTELARWKHRRSLSRSQGRRSSASSQGKNPGPVDVPGLKALPLAKTRRQRCAAWFSFKFTQAKLALAERAANLEWHNLETRIDKFGYILAVPLYVVCNLTVPVFDLEEPDWDRTLGAMYMVTVPFWLLFVSDALGSSITLPVLGAGALLGILVYFTSPREHKTFPRYIMVFSILAFASCVGWIFIIADELVALLGALGLISGIPPALLGLTILAWGNSLGDLISDVAIAKQGYPLLAVGACYGGPMLNLLLGFSIAMTYQTVNVHNPYPIDWDWNVAPGLIFLLVSLLASLFWIPTHGWSYSKNFAYFLYILYAAFLVSAAGVTFIIGE